MSKRFKIISTTLLIVLAIFSASGYYLNRMEYNSLADEARTHGIEPGEMKKGEIQKAIDQAVLQKEKDAEKNLLIQKCIERGLPWEGLSNDQMEKFISDHDSNQVSIRGTIFSIVTSSDKTKRTWLIVGEKMPGVEYESANCNVDGSSLIYNGHTSETLGFALVKEGDVVEVVFSEIVDENAVPLLANVLYARVLE